MIRIAAVILGVGLIACDSADPYRDNDLPIPNREQPGIVPTPPPRQPVPQSHSGDPLDPRAGGRGGESAVQAPGEARPMTPGTNETTFGPGSKPFRIGEGFENRIADPEKDPGQSHKMNSDSE